MRGLTRLDRGQLAYEVFYFVLRAVLLRENFLNSQHSTLTRRLYVYLDLQALTRTSSDRPKEPGAQMDPDDSPSTKQLEWNTSSYRKFAIVNGAA